MVRTLCELEVAEGLEDVARKELIQRVGRGTLSQIRQGPGTLQFIHKADIADLLSLKTIASVYIVHQFDIPRPKALLGHQNFTQILNIIEQVRQMHRRNTFQTLHLNAAGSNSSVMQRLKQDLSENTGLAVDEDEGDLLVRIRPNDNHWDVLVRMTPRPLATRHWRVVDFPGALNAPVAQAMVRLARIKPQDRVLNIMSGSGSLMIEAYAYRPESQIIGVEINPITLQAAYQNRDAAHIRRRIHLSQADAIRLPFAASYFDVLLADLPFGNLVGSHALNQELYPAVLAEAYRVAKAEAHFALITHEVNLMEQVLSNTQQWIVLDKRKINLRGLHPRIFLLQKSSENI